MTYRSYQSAWDNLNKLVQRTLTFILVCLGWVFFRAANFSDAFIWLRKLLAFDGFQSTSLNQDLILLIALNTFGLLIVNRYRNAQSVEDWDGLPAIKQFALGFATLGALIFMNYSSKFLYFQF